MTAKFSSIMVNGNYHRRLALRLMKKREVDPPVLIAKEYKLDDIVNAFDKAAQAGVLKVLVASDQI